MDAWTSRVSGLGLGAIQDGFHQHRKVNESLKRAAPIKKTGEVREDGTPGGNFTRVMRNRATYTERRATEMTAGGVNRSNVTNFVDRKVWSA